MRTAFDIGPFGVMAFKIGNELFSYQNTQVFAQIANMAADVFDEIRVTADGRAFYATVIAADRPLDSNGVTKGWYVVRWVTPAEAWKIRESWSVLRHQDDFPNPLSLLPPPEA